MGWGTMNLRKRLKTCLIARRLERRAMHCVPQSSQGNLAGIVLKLIQEVQEKVQVQEDVLEVKDIIIEISVTWNYIIVSSRLNPASLILFLDDH